jgi:hypothetical protein
MPLIRPLLFYMNLYIIFVLKPQKLAMCYCETELGESYQGLLETYSIVDARAIAS